MKRGPKPAAPVLEAGGVVLTAREVEVLQALAAGHDSNKAAALWLGVAPSTINDHLRTIFVKLKVKSRTAAAVWAVRNGVA